MDILVTGMGVVSPIGNGVPLFWEALCAGACGIRPLTRFDATDFACRRAGDIVGLRLPEGIETETADADPAASFMLAASHEALADAGWRPGDTNPHEVAVVFATNFGQIVAGERILGLAEGLDEAGENDAEELAFLSCADRAARLWGLGGPRSVLSLSCASGAAALAVGADLIRTGRATMVLAGGYDAISRFAWSGLGALRTMTADELRPFDRRRSGTLFSEGAAALVLEAAPQARRRKAPVHAALLGAATNNNAFHMTAPAKRGAGTALAMRAALEDAGLAPDAVDHVNTHGTGTRFNDVTETEAVKDVFGAHAARMPITAVKAATGHMMGAAGTVEAVASVLSLRDGLVPPTIHAEEPDPACDLDLVRDTPRPARLRTVLSNSAGIGGCNAVVIFGAPGEEA